MYSDTHIHTSFSGDSETPPEEQIARAEELGMKTVCITDHHDYDVVSDIDFELCVPEYISEIRRLGDEYAGRIEILTGIELGLQTHLTDYLPTLTAENSLDYVIGSVHFVDGFDPYYPEYFNKYGDKGYYRYYETLLDCVRAFDCFDSLGHLDYIVRYGVKYGYSYDLTDYSDIIDDILSTLIESGKALECNTGGLSRGLSEPNPCYDILKRYRQLGGELITLGADAHSPETLGYGFDKTGAVLKAMGYKYYAVYRNRKPCMEKL